MGTDSRLDLRLCRPWKAVPHSSGAWAVVAPLRYTKGEQVVAFHLSEEDAKAIAAAGNLDPSAPPICVLCGKSTCGETNAYDNAVVHPDCEDDFDPVADDEETARRGAP